MGEKTPRRWYSILIIVMCIKLVLEAAISFRAAPKAVHIAFSQFAAVKNQPIPTYKSITRWLTQIGLYKLTCPKEQADDWALIIDNSVQTGTQKCLMILGIRLSKFREKALTFEDMEILIMELHNKSDAKIVCEALEKAQRKVGKAVMVCADDGPDLRGGIALFCEKHNVGRVFDIVHKIGTFLKKVLEKDPEWVAFCSEAAKAKKKMQQTKAAHLAPPNQRTKSRFLNIEILTNWAIDVLVVMEMPTHPDKKLLTEYCGWICQHKRLIEKLRQLDFVSRHTRQYIREHGINSVSGEHLEIVLNAALKSSKFHMAACEYAGQLIDFMHEQSKVVPDSQTWIGSSEVIESLFGKLKCLEHDQSKGGFTSLVLGIAACVGKIDVDVIKTALIQVRTKDVEEWAREHIGETLLSKRRKSLGGLRKKKKEKKVVHKLTGISPEKVVGF